MKALSIKKKKGFSIIEILLGVALLSMVALTIVAPILLAEKSITYQGDRLKAVKLAEEGLEAVRNIKEESFANLTLGTYGLQISGGVWTLSGTSDITDNFIRTIQIQNVDSNTRRVTSTVTWPDGRSPVIITAEFADTERFVATTNGGMLVYSDNSISGSGIRYRLLDTTGNWGVVQTVPAFGVPGNAQLRYLRLYNSPTRNEKVLVAKFSTTVLGTHTYASVWNGISWGNIILLSNWAGSSNPENKSFDGDYINSGDFFVVYSDNTNIPKYRTWNGTSWSVLGSTLNIGGVPQYVVVANRPSSNELMVAVRDASSDTNTYLWNGSTWTGLVEHATTSSGTTFENVAFKWSRNTPTTGALVYTTGTGNNPAVRVWNGTTWSVAVANINIGATPRSIEITDRPGDNAFMACFKDSSQDINCLAISLTPLFIQYSGSEIEISTDNGNQSGLDLGYESVSGELAVIIFDGIPTNNQPKAVVFTQSLLSFGPKQLLGSTAQNPEVVIAIPNPTNDEIMFVMGSSNQTVYTITWDGSTNSFYTTTGKALFSHGTFGSNDLDTWFSFAWDN